MKKHEFEVAYKETDGGHTWINWRNYLHEFAHCCLFRIESKLESTGLGALWDRQPGQVRQTRICHDSPAKRKDFEICQRAQVSQPGIRHGCAK